MTIFGNGSAGSKHISVDTIFDVNEFNLQYKDFTIDATVTLTIPSGAILRCHGTFTNNGTLIVPTAAAGGQYGNYSSSTIDGGNRPAHPGVTAGAAGTGAIEPWNNFSRYRRCRRGKRRDRLARVRGSPVAQTGCVRWGGEALQAMKGPVHPEGAPS